MHTQHMKYSLFDRSPKKEKTKQHYKTWPTFCLAGGPRKTNSCFSADGLNTYIFFKSTFWSYALHNADIAC